MSDLSVTIHNIEALATGKIDFSAFRDGELAIFHKRIDQLPATLQPVALAVAQDVATGASALVGLGLTPLGHILTDNSADQATFLLNLAEAAGIPTGGTVLNALEQAALVQLLNGVKTLADRWGLSLMTQSAATPAVAPAPTPQPDPVN